MGLVNSQFSEEVLEPFKEMSEGSVTFRLESKPGVDENFKASFLKAPQ